MQYLTNMYILFWSVEPEFKLLHSCYFDWIKYDKRDANSIKTMMEIYFHTQRPPLTNCEDVPFQIYKFRCLPFNVNSSNFILGYHQAPG